jgi:hypothetical protein
MGMGGSQRPTRAFRGDIATRRGSAAAGGLGQVQRYRMVRAEHSAAPLQGVLAQGVGRLRLAHLGQGDREGGRRIQGKDVVRAEYPVAAFQGVLAPVRAASTSPSWSRAEVRAAAANRVIAWSGPNTRLPRSRVSSPRARAGSSSPTWTSATVRAPAAIRVVGWSGPQHPAAALQGVLAQGTGRLRLAHRDQRNSETAGGGQGMGMVGAEDLTPAVEQLFADGSAAVAVSFGLQVADGVQDQCRPAGEWSPSGAVASTCGASSA